MDVNLKLCEDLITPKDGQKTFDFKINFELGNFEVEQRYRKPLKCMHVTIIMPAPLILLRNIRLNGNGATT